MFFYMFVFFSILLAKMLFGRAFAKLQVGDVACALHRRCVQGLNGLAESKAYIHFVVTEWRKRKTTPLAGFTAKPLGY